MPTTPLATPQDLRRWLGLDADDTDELGDELAELVLAGVTVAALNYCGRVSFLETEATVRVNGTGSNIILLPGAPVTAVDSVVVNPDNLFDGEATDVTTDIAWDSDGVLECTGVWPARRRYIEVTFTSGFATVDDIADVRSIVLRVAARAISNPEGLVQESVAGYQAGYSFDTTRLPDLSPPDRAGLDPYRL